MENVVEYFKEDAGEVVKEKFLNKTPGLGLATASSKSDFSIFLILMIWVLVYLFYRLGSLLDKIFDFFYSEPRDTTRRLQLPTKLARMRRHAASKLHEVPVTSDKYTTQGLYKTAEKLFGKTEDWDKKVKPLLNVSKAARTFVIPLALILVYDAWPDFQIWLNDWLASNWLNDWLASNWLNYLLGPNWQESSLVWSILRSSLAATLLLIISLILYAWLRARHMVALYKLIVDANVFSFTVDVNDPRNPQGEKRKIVCVGNAVSPVSELPIFRRQPEAASRGAGNGSSGGGLEDSWLVPPIVIPALIAIMVVIYGLYRASS